MRQIEGHLRQSGIRRGAFYWPILIASARLILSNRSFFPLITKLRCAATPTISPVTAPAKPPKTSIMQIEYYKDTRVFESEKDLDTVYTCLQFSIQARQLVMEAPFKFYINEFVIGDNTYLVRLNKRKLVLLNHAVMNTVRTKDANFTQFTDDHFQNIIRRSTQISGVGEKERTKYFNILREKIKDSRKRN
jgi:hypothetical protein